MHQTTLIRIWFIIAAMQSPIRVGIVGLGDVAVRRHLPVLMNHPQIQVTAAADVNPERAETVARQFKLANVSTDARAVCTADETDVVVLLTPPFAHAALAHLTLEIGKSLFIEKPMTVEIGEGKAIVEHADKSKSQVLLGFNQRHHLQAMRAREIIHAGELGTIRSVSTFLGNTYIRAKNKEWSHDPARGGDPFFEYGVHHFDLLRFLLSAEVKRVLGFETTMPSGATTHTTVLHFENDVIANTTFAEDTLELNALEIFGDRGMMRLSLYRYDGLRVLPRGKYDGDFGLRFSETGKSVAALPSALPRIRRGGDYVLTYAAEWDHMVQVVRNNAPPLATVRDGLAATQIAHAARESILNSQPIAF